MGDCSALYNFGTFRHSWVFSAGILGGLSWKFTISGKASSSHPQCKQLWFTYINFLVWDLQDHIAVGDVNPNQQTCGIYGYKFSWKTFFTFQRHIWDREVPLLYPCTPFTENEILWWFQLYEGSLTPTSNLTWTQFLSPCPQTADKVRTCSLTVTTLK